MAGVVVQGYGDALFEVAKQTGKLDLFKEECKAVSETFSDELMQVMNHPNIHKDEKKKCLTSIYAQQIDPLLLNLMKIMVDKGRFMYFKAVSEEYERLYNQYYDIAVAEVESACALSDEDKARIKETLEKKTNQKVACKWKVEPSLLAGLRVKINDQILDNSAANRLVRLKEKVVKPASNE